ncbi:MAG: hypothetical protein GF308_00850 [Candidatus Heimdallarchaeota archaeon]|nr:hypothetical protein [Candidatus Heimdallarchaeota archaeon]
MKNEEEDQEKARIKFADKLQKSLRINWVISLGEKMTKQPIKDLTKKQLIAEFNNHLYSAGGYEQEEIIKRLEEMEVNTYELFPRLTQALEKNKEQNKQLLELLKKAKIKQANELLKKIFDAAITKEVSYYALEARGLLDWKNYSMWDRVKFKEQLQIIIEGYKAVYQFLARAIAYWHFKKDFQFGGFICGARFDKEEDKPLMESLILKMLKYQFETEVFYLDYEAANLAGRFKIKKAVPFLIKGIKCIEYQENETYDPGKDRYCFLRMDAATALADIGGGKKVIETLLEALQREPYFEVFLRIVYAFGGEKEAVPYLKGVKHGSIGKCVTDPDEQELAEAMAFTLKKYNSNPTDPVEYAAERIVFFKFEKYDEEELTRFLEKIPKMEEKDYEKLFVQVLKEQLLAGENFHNYEEKNAHLKYTTRMLLHIAELKKIPAVEKNEDEKTDREKKEQEKQLSRQTKEQIDQLIRKPAFIDKFQGLVIDFYKRKINRITFYEELLDVLYGATIYVIDERKGELRKAAMSIMTRATNKCSFIDEEFKNEILERTRELVYIDE